MTGHRPTADATRHNIIGIVYAADVCLTNGIFPRVPFAIVHIIGRQIWETFLRDLHVKPIRLRLNGLGFLRLPKRCGLGRQPMQLRFRASFAGVCEVTNTRPQ